MNKDVKLPKKAKDKLIANGYKQHKTDEWRWTNEQGQHFEVAFKWERDKWIIVLYPFLY